MPLIRCTNVFCQCRLSRHRSSLEACNFGFKKKSKCTIHVAKTNTVNRHNCSSPSENSIDFNVFHCLQEKVSCFSWSTLFIVFGVMNNTINKGLFIKFHACVLKLQIFKKSREFFSQFFSNVTIDVNGKASFSKFR